MPSFRPLPLGLKLDDHPPGVQNGAWLTRQVFALRKQALMRRLPSASKARLRMRIVWRGIRPKLWWRCPKLEDGSPNSGHSYRENHHQVEKHHKPWNYMAAMGESNLSQLDCRKPGLQPKPSVKRKLLLWKAASITTAPSQFLGCRGNLVDRFASASDSFPPRAMVIVWSHATRTIPAYSGQMCPQTQPQSWKKATWLWQDVAMCLENLT